MNKELKLNYKSPEYQIRQKRQQLIDIEEQLKYFMKEKIHKKKHSLELYMERMKGLSPINKLQAGYGYIADKEGHSIRSIEQVVVGDKIEVVVTDGKIEAVVEKILF